jgi:hypothetical protein
MAVSRRLRLRTWIYRIAINNRRQPLALVAARHRDATVSIDAPVGSGASLIEAADDGSNPELVHWPRA